MIFPLALAPFEEYMLADDRPAYPMTFFLRLQLAGRFGPETFPQALRTTISRHPLLCALVRQVGRRHPEWIAANRADLPVHRMPQLAENGLPHADPIDLRREPGLRLWLLEGERTTDLVAQFHHACCDGLGAVAFIEDLLIAYAMAVRTLSKGRSLCPIEFERLRGRARFGWSAWSLLKLLPRQLVGLAGVGQFFAHAPSPAVPLSAGKDASSLPVQYPAVLDRQLTVAETTALGRLRGREEATVNDILVRDWFLAMGDWRGRCFAGRSATGCGWPCRSTSAPRKIGGAGGEHREHGLSGSPGGRFRRSGGSAPRHSPGNGTNQTLPFGPDVPSLALGNPNGPRLSVADGRF